jgi:hypothetical protein
MIKDGLELVKLAVVEACFCLFPVGLFIPDFKKALVRKVGFVNGLNGIVWNAKFFTDNKFRVRSHNFSVADQEPVPPHQNGTQE